MQKVEHGTILWRPSPELIQAANITGYQTWLRTQKNVTTNTYHDLWQWSVNHIESFWVSILEYFEVEWSGTYTRVLSGTTMPGARWFEGVQLNYTKQVFRQSLGDKPAIISQSEVRPHLSTLSWRELEQQVAAFAAALRHLGVVRGDRVAAYLPNIPETVVAFLACASLGAVWSSCSPDFGDQSAIARFAQIEPKVLLAIDGYAYHGKQFDRRPVLSSLQNALPSLNATIVVPYLYPHEGLFGDYQRVRTFVWPELIAQHAGSSLLFEDFPFNHPLWILYSSGTTGLPKAIVHGVGGVILNQLSQGALQSNIRPGDRAFWFTTTGWVMWNSVVAHLTLGATAVLYDGSPFYPSEDVLWKFAEKSQMTSMGVSPAYLRQVMKSGVSPKLNYDLSRLQHFSCTGAPLTPEAYGWVYHHVKHDVWLAPISGGTDVVAYFVGGCVTLPVRAGVMQCRALGMKVEAFDALGQAVIDEVGELVVTAPIPTMPLYLWNDASGERYHESYFDLYPGIWRHGDWICISADGSAIIYGRSDSTINRHGVRMGSSEIYRAVEALPEIADSLVVDLEYLGRPSYMPLFVVLSPGCPLDDALCQKVKDAIRRDVSPRHVPDEIYEIPDVPRTLNGKKLEVPIRKILMGFPLGKSVDPDAMSNPASLQFFVDFAATMQDADLTQ